MTTSSAQVRRLLSLVPFLQARPGVSISEVLETFNITERQLMADLNALWMCGLPGGLPDELIEIDMDAVAGEGVVHLSNADYLTRPLRFTRDEALSLLVALSAVAEMATGQLQTAAISAAEKLSVTTGHQDPVLLAVQTGDQRMREILLTAIAENIRLQLTYDGAARGETTYPVIDPAAIQMRDSVGYLQAWSIDRQAWRTYRLDRIIAAEPTGDQGDDHGPTPELPEGWFDGSDGEVSLELTEQGRWIVEYYPVLASEELPDGCLRVRLAVADAGWLTALLLRLGAAVRQVEPHDARLQAIEAARQAVETTMRICGTLPN